MFQTSYTHTSRAQPDTQNDDFEFPQEASLFVAGKIAPRLGTFLQLTYEQASDHFGMDNAEFRFADTVSFAGKPLQYGLTLNNSPGLEDLWNSTPVWGYPYAGSGAAPSPTAAPLLQGALAQEVAGLGAYAMWDGMIYGNVTLYRSAHLGSSPASVGSENTIDSLAPYWRLAWQHTWGNNYLEIGTFGLWAKLFPEGITGLTDRYTDIAGDVQYEHKFGLNQVTVHGSVIHENRKLDASVAAATATNASSMLTSYRLDAEYIYQNWSFILGYFSINGDNDPGLYPPGVLTGSRTGDPASHGYVAEVAYFPWRNVQLQLQYTGYGEFNGSSADYDGSGRRASDNNTTYVLAWFVW
jgi:hypothetical protein